MSLAGFIHAYALYFFIFASAALPPPDSSMLISPSPSPLLVIRHFLPSSIAAVAAGYLIFLLPDISCFYRTIILVFVADAVAAIRFIDCF